jgi:hypothetical protein
MCPYVDKSIRAQLDSGSSRTNRAQNAGQLTYKLQQELREFLFSRGLSYQTLAECLGALEGAKLDLTDRVVKPYEAKKRVENGDVWPSELTHAGARETYERVITHFDPGYNEAADRALNDPSLSAQFATGGIVKNPQAAIVGEHGPPPQTFDPHLSDGPLEKWDSPRARHRSDLSGSPLGIPTPFEER